MSSICPTVMPSSDDLHIFRAMMERVGLLSPRLQIDLMDGDFAPHRNTDPAQLWWPAGVQADLHVMYRHPEEILDTLINLRPHMIILHAEEEGEIATMLRSIKRAGIMSALALLPETNPAEVRPLIELADHVLIFGGKLGEPGSANLGMLAKVADIRAISPNVEIGWDGGANEADVAEIAAAGVDVINVGAALQRAENPAATYKNLCELIENI